MKKLPPETVFHVFYALTLLRLFGVLNDIYIEGLVALRGSGKLPFAWINFEWLIGSEKYIVLFLLSFLIVSYPIIKMQWVRILWSILILFTFGLEFAIDPGHPNFLFIWISIFFALVPNPNKNALFERGLVSAIHGSQIQILLIYSLTGLWKILSVAQSFFDPNLAAGSSYFSYLVASEFLNSTAVSQVASDLLKMPLLAQALSLVIVVFQILCLPIIFVPALYPLWGLLIALFHVGSLMGLGIMFIPPIILAIVFLTLADTDLPLSQNNQE